MIGNSGRLAAVLCWLITSRSALPADDYTELFRQAAIATSTGDYQKAISGYKAALRIRPGAPEALNNLAVAYYEAHQYSDALAISSQIWESHKELPSAALICGLAAVQCNRPQDALKPFASLLATEPSNRDALLGLASARYALGELPQAVEVYRREIGFSAKDAQAWYGLAICYEKMAESASRKLAETPAGAAYSKRLVGEYLQSAGDAKLAAEAFGDAAAVGTSSREAEQEYEKARELARKSRDAFEQFIALAPDSWQAAVFLGDIERQHGKLPEALAQYRRATELQPGNQAARLGVGTVYWEMGDFERAEANLEEVLKVNPQPPQALFELANIAVRKHEEERAIPLLKQYLALQPDALAAHADLGRAYLHLGRYKEAANELTIAQPADERGEIHYQLSLALRKLGRIPEADAALKRSVAIKQAELEREQRLKTQP